MKKWLNSVYSDASENFVSNPYPQKGETVTFSLRVLKDNDIRHVFLRSREFGVEHLSEMKREADCGSLSYYTVTLPVTDKIFRYQFYLVTDTGVYYYTQFRITDYIPAEDADFLLLVGYDAPAWVRDTVFYQIFPDRFCNGNTELDVKTGEYSYQGFETRPVADWNEPAKEYEEGRNLDFHNGDLYGIIEKLDYLQELGINGIYLNPIFLSPSVHKYDALDYFQIDPHLGGDEGFALLIKEMHQRGMKLLLDISINHTSSAAKWFNKASEFYPATEGAYQNPSSPEWKYYFFGKNNSYKTWYGVETMPQLNYTSPELRDTIYRRKDSVLKKWLTAPYGIDGWRFDVADCLARNDESDVHEEVLREIHAELKSTKRDVYLVAEEWADCSVDLQGDRWDATMNYFGCARPLREFAGAKDLFNERNETLKKLDTKLTARQLAHRLCQFYARLPGAIQSQQFNLLDSHDVIRLHSLSAVSKSALKGAVIMLFMLPGSPSVYYGDEIMLEGRDTSIDACRYPFNWNWEKDSTAVSMRNFYKKLISLRRTEKALTRGSFSIISAEQYVISFARFTRDEMIFVISSTDDEARCVTIPLEYFNAEKKCVSEDCLGSRIQSELRGGDLLISVPPHESYVFKLEKAKIPA